MQCNERDLQNVGTREKSEVHGIDIGGKHATTTEVEVGKERVLETELGLCGDIEPFESPNGALELAKTSGKPVPLQPQPEAAEIIAYGRATGSRRRRRREVVGDVDEVVVGDYNGLRVKTRTFWSLMCECLRLRLRLGLGLNCVFLFAVFVVVVKPETAYVHFFFFP